MKLSTLAFYVWVLPTVSVLAIATNLRARGITQDASSCNKATNQGDCFNSKDATTYQTCEWCVAGAISSECMSQDQAKLLPKAVFECSTPSRVFQFKETTTHSLRASETDSDICDASSKSISGYMDIKGSDYDKEGENKHLFFWMFEKRNGSDDKTPFIVWLTGGPGCSSTLALLAENGPCSVNKDGETTTVNPHSWTEAAHVLWLDQPAGVGFSYGKETDSNEEMVGEDAYYFLQAFFQTYPQYTENPLYIVGESYGGHYAPAIAHRVWKGNQANHSNTTQLNLAGVGVGNGLTDPEEQYKWYPEMGFNNSHGIQVFSQDTYDTMKAVVPKCTAMIEQCNKGDSFIDNFACQTAFLVCNAGLTSPYQMTGLNPYDITKKCGNNPLCYDFSHVAKWLRSEKTKKALNVDENHSHAWETCNFMINSKFHTDWMKDYSGYVADLLNAGIPALMYAGDLDFICNYLGNKAWTYNLQWNGQDDFQSAEEHDWKNQGRARTAQGFTFLQVYDAGHMVPADQPEVALDMIKQFTSGGSF